MIYFGELKVGEGIAGPSTIGLGATLARDGIGIAFVNRMEQFGGLYHCPAHRLRDAEVGGAILQMINDIEPDEIVVTPAAAHGNGCSEAALAAVTEFLRGTRIFVTIKERDREAQLLWRRGDPVVNEPPEARSIAMQAAAEMSRASDGLPARKLEANIWRYGETDSNEAGRIAT